MQNNNSNSKKLVRGSLQQQMNQLSVLYHANDWQAVENIGKQFIRIYPQLVFGWKVLGSAAVQRKAFDLAIDYFQKGLKLNSQDSELYHNSGIAYRALKQFEKAIAMFRQAIELNPNYAEAYSGLGNVFEDMGYHFEAIKLYRQALSLKSDFIDACGNCAHSLNKTGNYEEALIYAERCIVLNPNYAEAYNHKGTALKSLHQFTKALDAYRQAIVVNPRYAIAYNNMGVLLQDMRRLQESVDCLRTAIALDDTGIETYNNLGVVLGSLGLWEEAFAYQQAGLAKEPDLLPLRSSTLFSSNFRHDFNTQIYLEQARLYGDYATKAATPYTQWQDRETPQTVKYLKVGFVSGDFNQHPVGFFVEALFRQLANYPAIALYAYCTDSREDKLTQRIKPYFKTWRSIVGLVTVDLKLIQT